jgi:hypothetical protein
MVGRDYNVRNDDQRDININIIRADIFRNLCDCRDFFKNLSIINEGKNLNNS